MIRIFLTLTGSIITVAIAAPIPKELRTAPLEGTWKIVSLCCNGQPTASASSGRSTIDDQMLSLQDARKPPAAKSNIQFVYDPKTYAMDYSYCDRNFTGIYTIHGVTLVLCFNLKDHEHPTFVEAA